MNNSNISPEKITKPIQLLGAWLVGLFSINSGFLVAAVNLSEQGWMSGALVAASIINVPLFLIAVFILQTKFRPELQEDSYYSDYLSQKSNEPIKVTKTDSHSELKSKIELLESKLSEALSSTSPSNSNALPSLVIGINQHLEDKEKIKSILVESGVTQATTFGPDDEIPTSRVMSISQYLSNEAIQQVIALAHKLNLDGYRFYDNFMEETKEDVLIGSYGKIEYQLLTKNP